MNFCSSFRRLRSSTAAQRRSYGVLVLSLLFAPPLFAQVGDNNPSGASGIFNGQAGACGYDPYTGNASRSITDIVVSGAVGEYPLALVRTANSRAPSATEVFGWAGGWNHNYNWRMADSTRSGVQNFTPTSYTVDFPDGRVETFKSVTWDTTCYRVRATNGGNASSAGVRERLQPHGVAGGYAYLLLPDGGKVQFQAEQHRDAVGQYYYRYTATAIIDPYGLSTSLVWDTTGNTKRLRWVIEPSGLRNLHFDYVNSGPRIASVTASDGRVVQYNYIYCSDCFLDNVVYYGNPNWTARYKYCNSNIGYPDINPSLLWTCDDPMYPGPMKRIAYEYKPAGTNWDNHQVVYGQLFRERYWDGTPGHESSGVMVSQLDVGLPGGTPNNRKEMRWDGSFRTFTYNGAGYLTSCTDFMGHSASQGYDAYHYINHVTDRRGYGTDYTNDSITGNLIQIQYPLTQGDTRNQSVRPTVIYRYTNSYYLHTIQGENGQTTTIWRDANNNRVTEIDYPDGGQETFSYDRNHSYQIESHGLLTGGTENWTYDARHRNDTYRNPDSPSPRPSPSAHYYYDALDRVSNVHDALNHVTDYRYNDRGQITQVTLPTDPVDNTRHMILYGYNPNGDGTLTSVTDQLNHVTSFTYDDYRRLRSVTPPVRGSGDNGTYTTWFYYDDNGIANDYKFTDSNATWIKLPSGKKVHAVYDDNRRKNTVTAAPGTLDEATTVYSYDNVGNLRFVEHPLDRANVTTLYDERNRPYQITVGPSQTTTIWYDTSGHVREIDRANGQVITYDSFDAMNRVTQQSATNTRLNGGQSIRTSYSYYPSGPANLLNTFRDAHLFGGNDEYTCYYDPMGRMGTLMYPLDSSNPPRHRTEQWIYDAAGRVYQFTNRGGEVQTFRVDALNRMTGFIWNDGGTTPGVTFGYDAASRLTSIENSNATISRTYFNDNLLKSETETATGGVPRAVSYTYDSDGNRASFGVPGYTFNYDYTSRNQLQDIINNSNNATIASYVYDARGNVQSRTLNTNNTSSDYNYDVYDRVTLLHHVLTNGTRTIQYGYDNTNHSNNRLWTKRIINPQSPENNKGEVFSYDLADQVSAFQLDVLNPNQVPQPQSQTMVYDPNGNRQFTPNGQYAAANALSQYTTRTIAGVPTTAGYDLKGNTTTGLDNSTYSYDAQNRVLTAQKPGGPSMSFAYDGLNRQVSRTINGTTTYSVWDGWNLVQEYHVSQRVAAVDATYVYGASGLVRDMESPNHYYYQDASGSTSHIANNSGSLIEWYRYDLDGNPIFYDATDHIRTPNQSGYSVRHLFTGQQWYQDVGLYDMRNRFYSPDVGRFLQPDPIGFGGGNHLYRYCGNNPVTRSDSFGLQQDHPAEGWDVPGGTADVERVIVTGSDPIDPGGTGAPSGAGGAGGGGEAGGRPKSGGIVFEFHLQAGDRNYVPPMDIPIPLPPPVPAVPLLIDPSHPQTTAEFIIAGNMIEHGNTMDTTPSFDLIDLFSGGIAGLTRSSIRSAAAKGLATGADEAVFWTGIGRGGAAKAAKWAAQHGGSTLGSTLVSRGITLPVWNPSNPATVAAWRQAAIEFAAGARGNVRVLQGDAVRLDSIWRDEFRTLQANPNVNSIIMTNPEIGVELLLWSR